MVAVRQERVAERVAEDAAALAVAGRKPHNLTFLDSQYRRPPAPTLAGIDATYALTPSAYARAARLIGLVSASRAIACSAARGRPSCRISRSRGSVCAPPISVSRPDAASVCT